jgi:VWFA-related protein
MKLPIGLLLPMFLVSGVTAVAQDYEVAVTTVTVWVKATDHDKPVEGLKAEDFEVYEDNRQQPLTCFEEVRMALPPAEEGQAAAPQSQPQTGAASEPAKFVVFLDLLNTTPSELLKVRPNIQQFFEQIRGSDWQVMMAALLPDGKLGIVVPFTTNLTQMRRALYQAHGNGARDVRAKEHERQITGLLEDAGDRADALIRQAKGLASGFAREEKDEALFSLDAMASFGEHLGTFTEKEHVAILYISGGFNSSPGRRNGRGL